MRELTYTLCRVDEEIPLFVEYEISEYEPGRMWGPPEHCEPPSGGEVEELHIWCDGKPFAATRAEVDEIEAHICMMHEE